MTKQKESVMPLPRFIRGIVRGIQEREGPIPPRFRAVNREATGRGVFLYHPR